MLRITAITACCAIGAASAMAAAAAAPPPHVTWLGALDDEAGAVSAARGISPDGGTVVGISASDTPAGYSAFKWTAAGGMVALPSNGEGTATDTTNGGAFITGYQAFMPSDVWGRYWVNGDYGGDIGPTPGGRPGSVFTHGISNDGSVIVGYCFGGSTAGQVAFRWTSATGPVALPHLSATYKYSEAYAISGDGSTIVGTSDNGDRTVAARWTSSGVSFVGDLPGGHVSGSAAGVSPDGSIIVGSSSSAASGESFHEAFRWTQADGMQPLGLLGRELSHAEDVSADGSVVVGHSSFFGEHHAFIWTPDAGMRDLSTYLTDAGVDVGTWRFDSAQGVSDDGLTIAGIGRRSPSFNQEAFVVSVPEPAAAITCALAPMLLLTRRRRCPAG